MTEARSPESVVRRWCVIGTCVSVLATAYIGLVPFRFEWPPETSLLDVLLRRAEFSITSRANFIANALLFVPVGFFGTGAFIGRGTRASIAAAVCCLILGSAALSLFVETLQALTPSRTPSMADIDAQVVGTIIGIIGWLAVRRDVHAWAAADASSAGGRPLQTSLWLYAAFRALALLLPLDVTVSLSTLADKYRQGRIVINPLQSIGRGDVLQAAAADIALTAPIGLLAYLVVARVSGRRSFLGAVMLGAAFSAAMELAQVIVISRTADAADVITGTIGAIVGAAMGAVFLEVHGTPEAGRPHRRWPVAVTLLSLVIYAAYNLSPFDFTRPPDVGIRLSMMFQVPFYSYYESPELQALSGAALKILLGVPIGVFSALMLSSAQRVYPRAVTSAALLAGTAFFAAVETGQVFLPPRYPDNSDIVLAVSGMWAGWAAVRLVRTGK